MKKLDNLLEMSDKEIQDWLRIVSTSTENNVLPIALIGVKDNVKDCIFRNLSVRAKNFIIESIQEQKKNNLPENEINKNIKILNNLL